MINQSLLRVIGRRQSRTTETLLHKNQHLPTKDDFKRPNSSRLVNTLNSTQPTTSSDLMTKIIPPLLRQRREPTRKISRAQTARAKTIEEKPKRIYPIRKQFIYEAYHDLFTKNEVILLFKHNQLSTKEWNSIRSQLIKLSAPSSSSSSSSRKTQSPNQLSDPSSSSSSFVDKDKNKVQIQFLRTGLISPVLKDLLSSKKKKNKGKEGEDESIKFFNQLINQKRNGKVRKEAGDEEAVRYLKGNLTSITQEEFEPNLILKSLKVIQSHSGSSTKPQQKDNQKFKNDGKVEDGSDERLKFMIGFINHRDKIFKSQGLLEENLRELKVFDLDQLRGQIVGLVESLGNRLVLNLQRSAGGEIVRNIEGFRLTLEKSSGDQNQIQADKTEEV